MSRTEEISSQIIWLLSHMLFTLIVVCAVRGGYQFYQDWQSLKGLSGTSFDLSALNEEQKSALLTTLLDESPVGQPEVTKRKGR